MKFSCLRDAITKEISVAHEIISSRNSMSILSNVYLEAVDGSLIVRATDLKVGFETRIPVDVQENGATTIFCDKLLGILRTLPEGEVVFESGEQEKLTISPRFKKIDFKLKGIEADKYPEIESPTDEQFFELPQKDLIDMITQTVFAVSDDETRYFMNGVFFERNEDKLVMVATDGRRLSFASKMIQQDIPAFSGVIIPPKILTLVKRQASGEGQIRIAISPKHVFFEFENQKMSSALIEGQFPNYQRVIPEQQRYKVLVSRDEMNEALKRVSQLVEKSRRMYLQIEKNTMILLSEETEIGRAREEISCDYDGPESRIALNFQYLNDPLKVIDTDQISLQFTETVRALSLQAEPKSDAFHIIMPMQVE